MSLEHASPTSPTLPDRRLLIGACLVALLATTCVYWPCLDHGFLHWDDDENIVENEAYRGLSPRHLAWMFTTLHMGPYQPLSWLTFGVDYCVWGMDSRGYHLTNVLIHAVNAALVVWVAAALCVAHAARSTTTDSGLPRPWAIPVGALLAGLLWAVHPQRVESVAWVTERRDVVCGLFYLLCVVCYLRAHTPRVADRLAGRWEWLARLCCLLAVLGKGTAVSLPVVLLVLDVYPLRRLTGPVGSWLRRPQRSVIGEKSGYVAIALFAVAAGFWGQWQGGGLQPLDEVGLLDRPLLACHAVMFYLVKFVAPVGLSPMYPRPVPLSAMGWRLAGGVLGVVAISAALILLRRRRPVGLAAWLCYVAMLLPVSGLVTIGHELVADRYSYLATMPVAVLVGCALTWRLRRSTSNRARVTLVAATAGVLLVLFGATRGLIPIWHDDLALWEHAVAVDEDNVRARTNLGGAYTMVGRYADARAALNRAIELDPGGAKAHHNLGLVLRASGQPTEALGAFTEAIRLDADDPLAWEWRAVTLTDLGRFDEAIRDIDRAVELTASTEMLRVRLARAYAGKKDYDQAIAIYEALRAEGCRRPDVYTGLAEVHLLRDAPDEAAGVLLDAPPDVSEDLTVRYALARVRSVQGRVTEALSILHDVLTTWPLLRGKARLDPFLARVRDDARFERMLVQIEAASSRQR